MDRTRLGAEPPLKSLEKTTKTRSSIIIAELHPDNCLKCKYERVDLKTTSKSLNNRSDFFQEEMESCMI